MTIAAIETRYAGCRFRSRLEARYAVLFDRLGIAWEYEPQGYEVGPEHDRRRYLPDFWLPQLRNWVEVKGDETRLDRSLLMCAMDWDHSLPEMRGSARSHGGAGLLLLGPIPRPRRGANGKPIQPVHNQLVHHEGVFHRPVGLAEDGLCVLDSATDCPLDDVSGGCRHDHLLDTGWFAGPASRRTVHAYQTARSARFEHGEQG